MTIELISSAESFRKNLRKRIDDLDISDAEVARRAGMLRQSFWSYASGQRKPGLDVLDRIASAVQLSASDLISSNE